jgi:hypothetical protein
MFGSAMWCPNITDLSERYRVFAADVIDQGGTNVPTQPMNFSSCVRSSRRLRAAGGCPAVLQRSCRTSPDGEASHQSTVDSLRPIMCPDN